MNEDDYIGDSELAYELHRKYDEEWVGEGFGRTEVASAYNLGAQMTGGEIEPEYAELERVKTDLVHTDAIKILDGGQVVTNFFSFDTE